MKKFLKIAKKIVKAIINAALLLLMGYSEEGVREGYLDFSGEGRNKYGR